ncbi:MAG: type II toxin-antitoxin system RelE/ParE family toxin [Candidatus Omnitrophica bacterium]|nr:type II toxin-antitoxin system RelE/ParE family toxin [Candidatus Omnitrophota bacterium]
MHPYYLTSGAIQDLEEIYCFIARDNPLTAISFIDLLEEECKLLAKNSKMGRLREELASELRSFPVGDYIIFYREASKGIDVIRILHSSRDIVRLFL